MGSVAPIVGQMAREGSWPGGSNLDLEQQMVAQRQMLMQEQISETQNANLAPFSSNPPPPFR